MRAERGCLIKVENEAFVILKTLIQLNWSSHNGAPGLCRAAA